MHRLATHAATIAVATATATAAAEIIIVEDVNLTIPYTAAGLALNVVTGETRNDTSNFGQDLVISSFTLPGWDFFAPGGGVVAVEPEGQARVLFESDFVGPGLPLNTPPGGVFDNPAFWDVEGAYVGFVFENEATSTTHFGWAEVFLPTPGTTTGSTPGTLISYAFNSTPNQGLLIPEPATAGLAAVAGLTLLRRRR